MSAILTLDENFVPDVIEYIGTLFNDTKLLILIIVGLALGLWIIGTIISSLRIERS